MENRGGDAPARHSVAPVCFDIVPDSTKAIHQTPSSVHIRATFVRTYTEKAPGFPLALTQRAIYGVPFPFQLSNGCGWVERASIDSYETAHLA